ncbi:hypothetical protein, partial [Priestia megaterium]|uniref:hypothetical protein n=1 Tax=Priestia megaterium TaxID=1404 RepID=UPI002FFD8E1D
DRDKNRSSSRRSDKDSYKYIPYNNAGDYSNLLDTMLRNSNYADYGGKGVKNISPPGKEPQVIDVRSNPYIVDVCVYILPRVDTSLVTEATVRNQFAQASSKWGIDFVPTFHDLRTSNRAEDNIILDKDDLRESPPDRDNPEGGGATANLQRVFNDLRGRFGCPNNLAVYYVPNDEFPPTNDGFVAAGRTYYSGTSTADIVLTKKSYDPLYNLTPQQLAQNLRYDPASVPTHEFGHALFYSGSANRQDPEYNPNDPEQRSVKHNTLPDNVMNYKTGALYKYSLTARQIAAARNSPLVR